MKGSPRAALLAIVAAALALRLAALPDAPFFADVPANLQAVEDGRMIIQFPGYAPFHLLVRAVRLLTGSVFGALLLISLTSGLAAMAYVVRFAADRGGGIAGALPAAALMGTGVLPVYLSGVGASYALDMLAAAALLFYGHRHLRDGRPGDFYAALGAWLAGCLMRPLACGFLGLGIIYLLARRGTPARAAVSVAATAAAAALGLALTLPYYDSLSALLAASAQVRAELLPLTPVGVAANLLRLVLFPIWGLPLGVTIAAITLWRARRDAWDRPLLTFLLLTLLPYWGMLIRYVPHAGYYGILIPGIVALPWVAGTPAGCGARSRMWSLILAVVMTAQWWVARPVPTRGPVALVANVYMFQYSQAGIQMGMFETLASLSLKTGVWADRIPEARRERVRISDTPPPGADAAAGGGGAP